MYVYIVGRRVRAEAVGAAVWRADGLTAKASKTQQWRLMPGTQSESLSLDTLVCGTSTTMHSFCESYSRASPWIHASSPERPAMFQSAVTANFRAAACAWTAGQVGWQAGGRGTGPRALLEPACGAHLRAALQRVAPVDLLHLSEADRRGALVHLLAVHLGALEGLAHEIVPQALHPPGMGRVRLRVEAGEEERDLRRAAGGEASLSEVQHGAEVAERGAEGEGLAGVPAALLYVAGEDEVDVRLPDLAAAELFSAEVVERERARLLAGLAELLERAAGGGLILAPTRRVAAAPHYRRRHAHCCAHCIA